MSRTHALAQALGWPRTGFSDYLRVLMMAKGIADPSREQLQDLGQSLVEGDPEKFCRDVLANIGFIPGRNILLDGIRHVDIQQRIAAVVKPSRAVLIHLAADDQVVAKRVQERGASEQEFRRAIGHPVERDLNRSLPEVADFVIDAGAPLKDVLLKCLTALGTAGVDGNVIQAARATVMSTADESDGEGSA